MKNRKEKRAAFQGLYVKASYYAARHYARLASWSMRHVLMGEAVDY